MHIVSWKCMRIALICKGEITELEGWSTLLYKPTGYE